MFSSYTMYYNIFYTVIFLQFTTNNYTHLKTTYFTLRCHNISTQKLCSNVYFSKDVLQIYFVFCKLNSR